MNTLKSKNNLKTTIQWNWMTILFIGILTCGITSCEKNDNEPTGDGGEKETAYVRSFETYGLTNIKYLEATEDLATNPDLSQAVELGQNISVYSVGEYPMTVSSDAKTITKWSVDKTTLKLSVAGILSYASTGATSTDVVFVSETAAFINDLAEGVIVEFNPTTMEIVTTHNVTPVAHPDNFSFYTVGNLYNGKVLFPIQWSVVSCCNYSTPLYGTVGIFDPATGILTYDTDNRAIGFGGIFIDGDNAYVVPANSQNNWMKEFFGASPNPFTVLKLNSDGTFNDSYISDLSDGLPDATLIRSSSFVYQNKYVFLYSDDEIGTFDNRYSARGAMKFNSVSYDLTTNEAQPFAFDDGYNQVYLTATIDGVNYFRALRLSADNYDTDILVQNSLEDYSVISTMKTGGFAYLGKLW
tara:strand:+ start:34692 stop:35927 length:1236 start_codon:yes stop_codon:yes gene_type:complete